MQGTDTLAAVVGNKIFTHIIKAISITLNFSFLQSLFNKGRSILVSLKIPNRTDIMEKVKDKMEVGNGKPNKVSFPKIFSVLL